MSIVRTRITRRSTAAAMAAAGKGKGRRVLAAKADRVAVQARRLAASEGVTMTVERSGGVRPKGRPYERVSSPDGASQEWGTYRQPRRRILGRAADSA